MSFLGGAVYRLVKSAAGELLLKRVKSPAPGQIDLFSGEVYQPKLKPKRKKEAPKKGMEEIPETVKEKLINAIESIKSVNQQLAHGRDLDARMGGGGRYESDTWLNIGAESRIYVAASTISDFKAKGEGMGIDMDQVLAELGYVSPDGLSDAAAEWVKEVSPKKETPELISLDTLKPKTEAKADSKGRKRAPKGGGYFTNPSTGETKFFAGGKFIPAEYSEEVGPPESPQLGLFYDRLPDLEAQSSKLELIDEENDETEEAPSAGSGDGNDIAGSESGGTDGSGDRGADRTQPQLVTARAELTSAADRSLVPESVRGFLADHQQEGVAKAIAALNTEGGFLLADGTGAGKTRQQLAIAQNYLEQGKKVLIVSPAEVLKPNWKKGTVTGSFSKDAAAMGMEVSLTKSTLSTGAINLSTYENLSKLKGQIDDDTVLIFDEAHYMKNADSARTKHGIAMMSAAHAVLYATATPADKPEHIPYLFRSGIFKGHPRSFVYDWLGLVQKEVWTGTKTIKVWEMPKRGADQVYVKMAGLFDDLTERGLAVKREISMDGVNVDFKTVTLPDDAYSMLDAIADRYSDGTGLEKAQMLMHQRRQLEPYKIPAAVDEAREGLKAGEQVILFVSRVSDSKVEGVDEGDDPVASSAGTAGSLRQALAAAGITDVVELHGGAKTKAEDAMAAFQSGEAKVIIATVESGGTGVNLDDVVGDAPRRLVMVTPPFNAVNNLQAAGRVWRMTTKSKPTIKYLFTDTEVDAWNRQIIANKMAAVGAAVQGEVGLLDLPSDVSDEAIEAFINARDKGTPVETKDSPRLPEAEKKPPAGFFPNKYGGYTPDGQYVGAGDGYIRKEGGRWITYTKEQAIAGGKVEAKIAEPSQSQSGRSPGEELMDMATVAYQRFASSPSPKAGPEEMLRAIEEKVRHDRESGIKNQIWQRPYSANSERVFGYKGRAVHERQVKRAIERGEKVPEEVMRDYPHLRELKPKPQPQVKNSMRDIVKEINNEEQPNSKVEKKPEAKPVTAKVDRKEAAESMADTINAAGYALDAKTWTGGDKVRVYLNKPGSRNGFGFLEIGPDGKAVDRTTLRPNHPLLEELGDRLQKTAYIYNWGAAEYKFFDGVFYRCA